MALLQLLKVIGLVGATLLVGGPAFLHLIWRPSLRGVAPDFSQQADTVLRRRVLWLATAGGLLAAIAAAADLLRIASEFAGGAVFSLETVDLLPLVSSTNVGQLLVLRIALVILTWLSLALEPKLPRILPRVTALLSLAALGTFSMAGHSAAALGKVSWPVVSDLVHLAATAIWYGGLGCLVLLPWTHLKQAEDGIGIVGRTVGRFSRAGLITMAALALTGTLLAVRQLYGFAALVEHPYGEMLLVKLLFLVGVLGLAGFNHLVVKPRLSAGASGSSKIMKPFRWAVAGEVLLGLAVVWSAGLLSTTAPPQGEPLRVVVTMTDETITPNSLDLPANRPVRMTVVNQAKAGRSWIAPQLPHEMEGNDHDHGDMTSLIYYVEPGQALTQTFIVRKPGQYAVDCAGFGPTPNCTSGVITVR